jgi:1,4-alpha-glucan branching enzyme
LLSDWSDESAGAPALPSSNKLVIIELDVKLMSSDPAEDNPLAVLGIFESLVFEQLDYLAALGVGCIEMMPIEDTSQTLNWGYGTRFYFAPDFDLGGSIDARFWIKACHRRGIRVIMYVVMSFHHTWPLNPLARKAGL